MTTLEIDADYQSARLLNPVAPRVAYAHLPPSRELPANILFGVTFGGAPPLAAPVAVRVNLEPQVGNGLVELWYANGTVNAARAGPSCTRLTITFSWPSSKWMSTSMHPACPPDSCSIRGSRLMYATTATWPW